jgi:hypothetical protein
MRNSGRDGKNILHDPLTARDFPALVYNVTYITESKYFEELSKMTTGTQLQITMEKQ